MSFQRERLEKKRMLRIISASAAIILTIALNSLPAPGKSKLKGEPGYKPKVEVSVGMEEVKREQKSVDEGHSPWKLDPVYVSQVFVSLKLSPGGIVGEYPVKYEELRIIYLSEKDAVVGVSGSKTSIGKVYLKRLVRQDYTGIWTVVGYDPADKK